MKLTDLLNEIEEAEVKTNEVIDEIGKFFIVKNCFNFDCASSADTIC